MKDTDKWSMFKNYMHNELGIGREDIRQWIRDAVQDEVRRLVDQEAGKFDVPSMIEKCAMDRATRYYGDTTHLRRAVAIAIAEKFAVTIDPVP